ncbi:MAG: hypothetical protein IKO61_09965 [Lachnospiraceae bacterium]|nr:hypothetical protein [Lachnospiraceae bacterium]
MSDNTIQNIIFIFEDNTNMVTSKLLTQHSYNKNNIHFANGNGRLFKELKKWYDTSHNYCIYYDYSPENVDVTNGYWQLYDKVQGMDGYANNVMIIPIPCIEYIVLQFLVKYKYIQDNQMLVKSTYLFDYNYIRTAYPNSKSLERMYKHILNDYTEIEYHNIDMSKQKKDIKEGIFYTEGDLCRKAEQFYTTFPIFEVISNEHEELLKMYGINISYDVLQSVFNKINTFYKQLYDVLNKSDDFRQLPFIVNKR